MRVQLSDHFNYSRIFRFTLPSIIMMVFSSVYVIVDGLFVSNIVGSDALAAINLCMPALMITGGVGFMLGMGGNAQVAKTLGEGNRERAHNGFSLTVAAVSVIAVTLSLLCILFVEPLCYFLGATERTIGYCTDYCTIMMIFGVFYMLQICFQGFFITAEKPNLGLGFTVAAGVTNMVFDYVFICIFHLGISGAALASSLGYLVGGLIPLIYFLLPNNSLLKLKKPVFNLKFLIRSAGNGASEMVSEISYSVVTFLYNFQMLRLLGEDGVAAITVVLYINMIFNAIVMGYCFGISPVIGFHYGAGNHGELQNLFKRCLKIIAIVSVIMFALAQISAETVTGFFCGGNEILEKITSSGFHIYSISFLICGFNIFGSTFFTALCNGKISAIISFLRTLVMETGMLLLLPALFGIIGVWTAVPVTEAVTLGVCIFFWITNRKKYHYI